MLQNKNLAKDGHTYIHTTISVVLIATVAHQSFLIWESKSYRSRIVKVEAYKKETDKIKSDMSFIESGMKAFEKTRDLIGNISIIWKVS